MRPPAAPGRDTGSVPTDPPISDQLPIDPMPRKLPKKVKKGRGFATLVTVSLIVILAATIGGLYVFGPGRVQGSVTVTVDGPQAVTSGDEVTYTVTVANADSALDVADLTMEYPVGFLVTSANPPADNAAGQSLFRLAPIAAGGRVTVSITGRLLGSVGNASEVRARLDYEPENFSSSFQVEASAVTRIAASRIKLSFDAPATAVSPGELAMSVGVENVSDLTMNGMELVLEVPEGVSVTSSEPPLSGTVGELRYDLGTLESGARWSARLSADLVGDGGSRRGLAAAVYQRLGGQRVIVDRTLREVEVVQPAAAVELAVAGSTSTSATAAPGSSVPLAIRVANAGSVALGQLRLQLRVSGSSVDWASFNPASGQVDADAGTWGSDLPPLAEGETATVQLNLPIRSDAQTGDRSLVVAVLTSAAYGEDWQAGAGPTTLVVQ